MSNRAEANKIINRFSTYNGIVGIGGAFGAHIDIAIITFLWIRMTIKIAKVAGKTMSSSKAKR